VKQWARIRTIELHLVCPALFKESICAKCLTGFLGIGVYELERQRNAVNGNKGPGCL
jgi:hypothetical protein